MQGINEHSENCFCCIHPSIGGSGFFLELALDKWEADDNAPPGLLGRGVSIRGSGKEEYITLSLDLQERHLIAHLL